MIAKCRKCTPCKTILLPLMAISKQMMNKWEPWENSMRKSRNPRMLQQLTLHSQQLIKVTSTQDLDPRPLANNDHPSILPFEMHTLEPGETPSRTLKWNPLGFLSHIKRRTIGDRFPLSLWEVWFCSTLGVPAYVSIRQHTSAYTYVSTRQHTSVYVSTRQHT
jgi:hypothetical protein